MRPALPLLLIVIALAAGCGRDAGGPGAAPAAAAPVATDQGETSDDLALTKRIRQSLMADERLSSRAKNVAIITVRGRVTLRGTVRTVPDKAEVGVRARQIAGTENVENLIEVKGEEAR
jgi:osmotically-inducible protein OsmY